MFLEIFLTLIVLLVIGGLFYIILIQTDMLKNLHQRTPVDVSEKIIDPYPIPNTIYTEPIMDGHLSMRRRRKFCETNINYQDMGQSGGSLTLDEDKLPEKSISNIDVSESETTLFPRSIVTEEDKDTFNPAENKNQHKKNFLNIIKKVVPKGRRLWSLVNDEEVDPNAVREKMLNNLIKHSTIHEHAGSLKVYKLDLQKVCKDKHAKLEKFEFGKSPLAKSTKKEKVVMIVGATGSGKTTLINSMINYVFSVEYEDDFRFKLITEDDGGKQNQAHSQTSWITAYTIHHQKGFKVDFTLTIVDTPGFGDTRGIDRDSEITKQIRKFFIASGNQGIDHLDVVGFVAQSSLPRLTSTQKYIFDQILALFGKDIGQNIYLLLTFADGKVPQVLNGVQEARLPYQEYFKFNNSVIFDDNQSTDEFCKMFWKMGMCSHGEFFAKFSKITSKSLKQTKQVLDERERIETQVEGLQCEVKRGLSKLEELKKEVQVVLDHENDIVRNKDFTYTVNEDTIVKRDLKPGTYVTNCITCNTTCHRPCGIPNDENKYDCAAMDGRGEAHAKCRICPKGCSWQQHKNMQYYFVTQSQPVTKTSDELRQRYQDANGRNNSAQQIVNGLVNEFEAVQIKIFGITEVLRKSINTLNRIALKPTSLSTSEYITVLIQSERSAAEPGWQDRVQNLMDVKTKVESLIQISEEGYDPFEGFKRQINEEKQTKQGVWYAVGTYLEKIQFWTC